MKKIDTHTEPVGIAALVNAALIATVNVLAMILSWDATVVGLVNIAIGAWVVLVSAIVRRRVTPVPPS